MTMEECKSDTFPLYTTCLFLFSYYYTVTLQRYRLRLSLSVVWKHFILYIHLLYGSIYLEWCLRCYVPYDNDRFLHFCMTLRFIFIPILYVLYFLDQYTFIVRFIRTNLLSRIRRTVFFLLRYVYFTFYISLLSYILSFNRLFRIFS